MPAPWVVGRPFSFTAPRLDDMCCGTVELGVPVRGEAILIGAAGVLPISRIMVTKDVQSVRIHRLDVRPLHVFIHAPPDPAARDGGHGHHVFAHPVQSVVLRRIPADARWAYRIAKRLNPVHPPVLRQFAEVIGTFARAKQAAMTARCPGAPVLCCSTVGCA